jgi:hypothetical protein
MSELTAVGTAIAIIEFLVGMWRVWERDYIMATIFVVFSAICIGIVLLAHRMRSS